VISYQQWCSAAGTPLRHLCQLIMGIAYTYSTV